MGYIEFGGLPVAYRSAGSGPLGLVFLHGFCCSKADWDLQVEHFGDDGHAVSVDLIGHGESGGGAGDCTIERSAGAVHMVLDELGVGRVVLVGHSMGCRVVLQAYLDRPDRVAGLVFVDGSRLGVGDPHEVVRAARERIAGVDMPAWVATTFEAMFPPGSDPQLKERIMQQALATPSTSPADLFPNTHGWDADKMLDALEAVTVPVLAIQSTDVSTDLQRVSLRAGDRTPWLLLLEQHVRELAIDIIEETGHFSMIERAPAVNSAIDRFVGRLEDQRSTDPAMGPAGC